MHLDERGRNLLDTQTEARSAANTFLLKCAGTASVLIGEAPSPACRAQRSQFLDWNTPMAQGIVLPKHRDLVFLVTPSQSHMGNPSQQITSGCCNTSPPATPKSPGARQDGKQEGISMEKQVQKESPKVTNAPVWHLLSSDCTILRGFSRPRQLHTILRAGQLSLH